jgi:hypothetical protein
LLSSLLVLSSAHPVSLLISTTQVCPNYIVSGIIQYFNYWYYELNYNFIEENTMFYILTKHIVALQVKPPFPSQVINIGTG